MLGCYKIKSHWSCCSHDSFPTLRRSHGSCSGGAGGCWVRSDGVRDHAVGCRTTLWGSGPCGWGPYNMLRTSWCAGELGSCCPESTRANISLGTKKSELALPGTQHWGRRRCLGQGPASRDPTPAPSPLSFPFPRNHLGEHHPAVSAAPERGQGHWSPTPIASSHPATASSVAGTPASPQPCRDAACCRPGHCGAGCHQSLALSCRAPRGSSAWHPGAGIAA